MEASKNELEPKYTKILSNLLSNRKGYELGIEFRADPRTDPIENPTPGGPTSFTHLAGGPPGSRQQNFHLSIDRRRKGETRITYSTIDFDASLTRHEFVLKNSPKFTKCKLVHYEEFKYHFEGVETEIKHRSSLNRKPDGTARLTSPLRTDNETALQRLRKALHDIDQDRNRLVLEVPRGR